MCGICGIYNLNDKPVARDSLKKMARSMHHRGPDSEGFYINRNIGLGQQRLAIIDLHTGNQPMYNQDKNIVIVYNGEIYNYIELKEQLKLLGHHFFTESDTEVIIHAYEQWGVDCQNKFNGMWAFAIWDNNRQELFLSRDRIGEKPLHYAFSEYVFLFGSEIKSILAYGWPQKANKEFLEVYLSLGYIPSPFTFYENIHKLNPGCFLIVKNGNVKEYRYWDLPEIDEAEMLSDAKEINEKFEYLLKNSVKLRMRSDVSFGAFLSGGLDSSSIVALMSEISAAPPQTFTIGFNEMEYDERILARKIARKFNTAHHENVVSFNSFDNDLDRIIYFFDEPFGDSSAIPTGYVSRYARQKVKMVLTGDGGDEVLSGYTTYQGEKFAKNFQAFPKTLRNYLPKILHPLALLLKGKIRYKLNRLIRILESSDMSFENRIINKSSCIDIRAIKSLLADIVPQITIQDFISDLMNKCSYRDNFYKLMYFNFKLSLPDDMLVKVDRMSMANSLEVRLPFLDYRLVEFMARVDKNVKMMGFERKSLLRRTVGKKLPSVSLRTRKRGFVTPLREWFKEKAFENRLKKLYDLYKYGFNKYILKKIVQANIKGEKDHGNFIWILFVLKKWLQG